MVIDKSKRSTLYSTLKVLALATGAVVAPRTTTAACKHRIGKDAMTSTALRGTGLIVSFGVKPGIDGSRQVVITNTNDHPVTLTQVYPSIVSTPEGQYDLNSILNNGAREFPAKQATTVTIKVANNVAKQNQLNTVGHPMRTADSFIHVRTTSRNVNMPVTTTRQAYS